MKWLVACRSAKYKDTPFFNRSTGGGGVKEFIKMIYKSKFKIAKYKNICLSRIQGDKGTQI